LLGIRCGRDRGGQRLRQAGSGLSEQGCMAGRRGAGRHIQRELAGLGNADLLADQPVGGQLDLQRAALEFRAQRQRHGQQQLALIAVIDQRADRQALRRRPGDLADRDAGWQLPIHARRQARVAGVAPVGVPMWLVLDQEAQPGRLAGLQALGRMGDQFGPHLLGRDHSALGLGHDGQQKAQREPVEKTTEEADGRNHAGSVEARGPALHSRG
jgi:hypothetical protein